MTIEMGNLMYSGHNMHGLQYGAIEGGLDYGVHRAVATHGQGLHGLSYGYEYGEDASTAGTVKDKFAAALTYAKDNWLMIAGGVVVAALVAKFVLKMKIPLLGNPKKRRKSKKRKQTAKQRRASLANLKKGRSKSKKRRGSKVSRARKSMSRGAAKGKRGENQQKRVVILMRSGYSMADAWRIVKTGRKTAPKRSRSRSRSRSRR